MEILITGGNGFLGRHLIQALQKRGDSVRALSSPTGDTTWLKQNGTTIFRGDICKQDTLTEPMRGVDAVVHLVAETRKWGPMPSSYAVNVTGTEHVCQAAIAAGVRRMVHISTFTIYNMMVGRPVTEDDPLQPLDEPYSWTKAQGDRLVQRMIREKHLPAVIIQGRYDVVCPPASAFRLHAAWPEAKMHVVPDAGHAAYEPGIAAALVAATEQFRRKGGFD